MSDYSLSMQCVDDKHHGKQVLNGALQLLEIEAMSFSIRFIKDSTVRFEYIQKTKLLSENYLYKIQSGRISPYAAAEKINVLRNEIMELARLKSSDIGKASASRLKKTGKVLEDLCEYYAKKTFNKNFIQLTRVQQNNVYREIVKGAGRTRPSVNVKMNNLSKLGKGLLVLSLAIAVYNVATADDKIRAAGNEGVMIGGGILGGAAGGAIAGLACGPGAPVCVTVGIFVGGVLGSFGADTTFDFFF